MKLPQPPNQTPIQTVPDADIAIRSTLLQYLSRLVVAIQQSFITSFATWTPGTIANGGFASATVTVRGVAPPSPCAVGFTLAIPAGMILAASCTSADTVVVTLYNFTGNPQTIGAGTLQVTGSVST